MLEKNFKKGKIPLQFVNRRVRSAQKILRHYYRFLFHDRILISNQFGAFISSLSL